MTGGGSATILGFVIEVFGISLVFMAVAFLVRRPWTVAVPFVVWLGLAGLSQGGILPATVTLGSAVLGGAVGAVFAISGLIVSGRPVRGRPGSGARRPGR